MNDVDKSPHPANKYKHKYKKIQVKKYKYKIVLALCIVLGAGAQSCVAAIDNLRMTPFCTIHTVPCVLYLIYFTIYFCTIYCYTIYFTLYTVPYTAIPYTVKPCTVPYTMLYLATQSDCIIYYGAIPGYIDCTIPYALADKLCNTVQNRDIYTVYYTVSHCSKLCVVALTGSTMVDTIAINDDSPVATASH